MGNSNLHSAKKAKNDEFYTQIETIEKELIHYRDQFEDKVVFLNCDDPQYSNFWKYFEAQFHVFGLKKLVSTHYNYEGYPTYKLEWSGVGSPKATPLNDDGDFRGEESIELLKEADIVVTNPPFSLFREYVAQLIEFNKKFLIVGPLNALTTKDIFPLVKDNKMWLGYSSGKMVFRVPDNHEMKNVFQEDGKSFAKFGNISWYTNLETTKRQETIYLKESYDPELHLKYDNYDAIEVGRVALIPKNWSGVMGVPISYIGWHNPSQFEIVGADFQVEELTPELIRSVWDGKTDRGYVNGKRKYSRVLIRNRHPEIDKGG